MITQQISRFAKLTRQSARFKRLLQLSVVALSSFVGQPVALAGQTLITFDDAPGGSDLSGDNPYKDLGIGGFVNVFVNIEDDVSVKNLPSSPYYMLLYPGTPINGNVTNGFTAISLYYVNGNTAGQLRIYSGLNGAGTVLASISLPQTPITGGTTLQTWIQKSLSHSTAHSFQISGVAQYLAVDNVRITGDFPPRIIGGYPSADAPTASTATLDATVNPSGAATSVHFELDPDPFFSNPATTVPQNIGSGTANVAVTQLASGLARGTTFYFRVVASNETSVVTSDYASLTTQQTTVQTFPPPQSRRVRQCSGV